MEVDGIAPIVVVSADPNLAAAAHAAVLEAGAASHFASSLDDLDRYQAVPKLVICGADLGGQISEALARLWPVRQVRAALGETGDAAGWLGSPAGTWGSPGQGLVLPRDAAALVRVVEEVMVSRPTSTRLMVCGAHGGVGASSLAAVLARRVAGAGRFSRLADLDGAGAPLPPLLGLAGGGDWSQAMTKWGVAWNTLPGWSGVSVLAGLQAVVRREPAHRLRDAIEQWEQATGDGVTVLDVAPGGNPGAWRVATWCDQVVVVARDDPAGLASAKAVLEEVIEVGAKPVLALRGVKGGAGVHGASRLTPATQVLALGFERNVAADSTHGLAPGDRPGGAINRWAANYLKEHLGLAGGEGRRRRVKPPARRTLPQMNAAAMAEDW